MTTLDKFYELKDSAYKKFEEYIKEGKTPQSAIKIIQGDIDAIVAFLRENREEIQKEFTEEYSDILIREGIDPLLSMIMTMMFDGYKIKEKQKS